MAQPARPPRAQLGERELVLENNSGRAINEVYISPSATDHWGEDRLGEATLEPGASIRLRLGRLRDCAFDVQIIYDDASREERIAQDVCRTRTLVLDGAGALRRRAELPLRRLVMQNRSASPILQLFISPADQPQWGEDLLAAGRLAEGETRELTYNGDCAADLRIVFANRAAEERRGLDLCARPALAIEPGWTTADPPPEPAAPTALSRVP